MISITILLASCWNQSLSLFSCSFNLGFKKFSSILWYQLQFTVTAMKCGPHMPNFAIAHYTITLEQCNKRLCRTQELFSAHYWKFCLLAYHTSENVRRRCTAPKHPCEHVWGLKSIWLSSCTKLSCMIAFAELFVCWLWRALKQLHVSMEIVELKLLLPLHFLKLWKSEVGWLIVEQNCASTWHWIVSSKLGSAYEVVFELQLFFLCF